MSANSRRIIGLCLSVAMLISLFAVSAPIASAASWERVLSYKIDELTNTCEITACRSLAGSSLEVPAQIEGATVVSVGAEAFKDCGTLSGISFPDTVTSFGANAFNGCKRLRTISAPGVKVVGAGAFEGTKWQEAQSEGLVYFNNCLCYYKGTIPANTVIELAAGTVSISENAFLGQYGLVELVIPEGVEYIGAGAMKNCTKLKDISFPASLLYSDYSAVESTRWLIEKEDGLVYFGTGTLAGYKMNKMPKNAEIVVEDGVRAISANAFAGRYNLDKITIPASVEVIGANAIHPHAVVYCDKGSAAEYFCRAEKRLYFYNSGEVVAYNLSAGDVNGDMKVTTDDARLILRVAVGVSSFEVYEQTAFSDIDRNGVVSTDDARAVLRYAVGLDKELIPLITYPKMTKDEIFALYSTAVNNAREDALSYKLKEWNATAGDGATITSPDKVNVILEPLIETMYTDEGSAAEVGYDNLVDGPLVACTLKDMEKITTAEVYVQGESYFVTLAFVEEMNSVSDKSFLPGVTGNAVYTDVLAADITGLAKSAADFGVEMKSINELNVLNKGLVITAQIALDGRLIEVKHVSPYNFDFDITGTAFDTEFVAAGSLDGVGNQVFNSFVY